MNGDCVDVVSQGILSIEDRCAGFKDDVQLQDSMQQAPVRAL